MTTEPAPGPRRPWLDMLVCVLVLAAVVAGRGFLLAHLMGGRYLWTSALVDALAMAGVILAFRLLDLGVKALTRRVVGGSTPARRRLAVALSWAIVFAVATPFLMALVLFHPQRIACATTPAAWGMPATDVALEADGLRLAGWYVPASHPDRPVVVIAHGVGANKQNFLPAVQVVHALDYHAFIFDFRGHGDSEGRTITYGVKESADVGAAYEYVVREHPASRVYGLGYSMGGTALARFAAEGPRFDKVVLDSTFGSAERVGRDSLLWFFGPVKAPVWHIGRFWGWTFTGIDIGRHRPEEYIHQVAERPLLLIHGTADTMIPTSESVRLREAAGAGTELWLVEGVGHLGTLHHPEYVARLRAFFEAEP